MKTPDDIKKNARTCIAHPVTEPCGSCELYGECRGNVNYNLKDLLDLVLLYESRLAQVERERDAAVADLKVIKFCALCEEDKNTQEYGSDRCHSCVNKNEWRWRGVCEENTHDQP